MVFRYAWRVLAWTALTHVGDIGETINVTILLLTHDCFQRAGYPKPINLCSFWNTFLRCILKSQRRVQSLPTGSDHTTPSSGYPT